MSKWVLIASGVVVIAVIAGVVGLLLFIAAHSLT